MFLGPGGESALNGTGNARIMPRLPGPDGCMDRTEIERWLEQLRVEHRDLDEVIKHLVETGHSDAMRIQRLKKRKLRLKDMIAKLESELIPDLDA
jgi:hypothetical protein